MVLGWKKIQRGERVFSLKTLVGDPDRDALQFAAVCLAALHLRDSGHARTDDATILHQSRRVQQHLEQLDPRLARQRPLLRSRSSFQGSIAHLEVAAAVPPTVDGALLRDGRRHPGPNVTPDGLAGGEKRPVVALRPEENYEQLRHEEENPRDGRAQRDAHARGDHPGVAPEVDRHERHPDHARRVHGEPDELGLVEVLWNVPRLERVQRTQQNQHEVVRERHDDALRGRVALQQGLGVQVNVGHARALVEQHPQGGEDLNSDQHGGDDDLRRGGHEQALLRGEALLGSGQDARDPVGLGEQRRVDHGEADAREQTRQGTRRDGRFREDRKDGCVGHQHPGQDDVRQFPGGGLHHGSVVVPREDDERERRGDDPQAREDHGDDGLHVRPTHVINGEVHAT